MRTSNAFCPTGPGGGVDPHCSPKASAVTSSEFTREGRSELRGVYRTEGRRFEVWLRHEKGEPHARLSTLRSYGEGKASFKDVLPEFIKHLKSQGIKEITYSTALDEATGGKSRDRLFGMYAKHAQKMLTANVTTPRVKKNYDPTNSHRRTLMSRRKVDEWLVLNRLRRILVRNGFCKTGKGGGVDPTCGTGKAPVKVSLKNKAHRKVAEEVVASFPKHLVAGLTIQNDTTGLAKGTGGAYSNKNGKVLVDSNSFSPTIGYTTADLNGKRTAQTQYKDQYKHAEVVTPDIGAHLLKQTLAHEVGHYITDQLSPDQHEKAMKVFAKDKVDTHTVGRYNYAFYERAQDYKSKGLSTGMLDRRLVREKIAEAVRLKVQEPKLYKKQVGAKARGFLDTLFKGH